MVVLRGLSSAMAEQLLLEPVDVEEDSVQLLLVGIGGGGRIGGTSESTGRSEHISTEQALLL